MKRKKILFLISSMIALSSLYGNSIITFAYPDAGVSYELTKMVKEAQYIQNTEHKTMYANTRVNIRKKPNTDSEILNVLNFNESIEVFKENKKGWYKVKYDNQLAYVKSEYLDKEKKNYQEYNIDIPIYFKSYTDYRCITATDTPQYKLQKQYAYTGNYGIRMVDDRYCVAIGSRFDCNIGQYFDIVLENGTVIKAIKTDEKADKDTDSTGTYTCVTETYCATEFYIDSSSLVSKAKNMGDLSYATESWNSRVIAIRVYDKMIEL